jgi:AAA15 family ATPase/GTPase
MFLDALEVKNYRSLEDVKLDSFDRFNVLIGRNNTGKSSVIGVLDLLNVWCEIGSPFQ